MAGIKIGIVEDEIVIARTIENTLETLGYNYCGPADNYTEALEMIADEKPDLLLLDVNLSGKKDGIDVATKVNELYNIPFIFLTAFSDMTTIQRAKLVKPHAYMVKPFTQQELYASIEIALANFSANKNSQAQNIHLNKDFAFFKDGQIFHKVFYSDISYLESDDNYSLIYLENGKKIMIRTAFNELIQSLPTTLFVRTHRCFAINIDKIKAIEPFEILIGTQKIPVSKVHKEEVWRKIGLL